MNKYMKKIAIVSMAALLGVSTLTGCGKSLDGTKTVATLDKESIPLGVASFMVRFQQAQIQTYYGSMLGENIWSTSLSEDEESYGETVKSDIMDSVEEYYLLKSHAAEYDYALTEEDNKAIEEAAQKFIDANDAKLLEKMGVSKADMITVLELYTYKTKMEPLITADVDTEVSDEEAAQTTITYVKVSTAGTEKDEDGKSIELTEEEKAAKKDMAQQIYDKVAGEGDVAAADMDAIAKAVDETLSKTTTSYGSDDENLDAAVKEAVQSVTDGQLTGAVVEGEDGYYVVRMDKVFDEDATASKKESIVSTRKTDAYQAKIDEWKDAAEFKVVNKVWKKVELKDNEAYKLKTEAEETKEESTGDITGDTVDDADKIEAE